MLEHHLGENRPAAKSVLQLQRVQAQPAFFVFVFQAEAKSWFAAGVGTGVSSVLLSLLDVMWE